MSMRAGDKGKMEKKFMLLLFLFFLKRERELERERKKGEGGGATKNKQSWCVANVRAVDDGLELVVEGLNVRGSNYYISCSWQTVLYSLNHCRKKNKLVKHRLPIDILL